MENKILAFQILSFTIDSKRKKRQKLLKGTVNVTAKLISYMPLHY